MKTTDGEQELTTNPRVDKKRETKILRLLEDIAIRLDAATVDLTQRMEKQVVVLREENDKMRDFYVAALAAHEKLLNRTSQTFFEKALHETLAQMEEEKKRLKSRRHGGGFDIEYKKGELNVQ